MKELLAIFYYYKSYYYKSYYYKKISIYFLFKKTIIINDKCNQKFF